MVHIPCLSSLCACECACGVRESVCSHVLLVTLETRELNVILRVGGFADTRLRVLREHRCVCDTAEGGDTLIWFFFFGCSSGHAPRAMPTVFPLTRLPSPLHYVDPTWCVHPQRSCGCLAQRGAIDTAAHNPCDSPAAPPSPCPLP